MSKGITNFNLEGVDLSAGAVSTNSLYNAVMRLPSSAKKAMYAAAASRTIKRSTWNGCAFNAGGIEIGNENVNSFEAAAEAFKCPVKVVRAFISAWDGLEGTDDYCNGLLRETLESVGLFDEPTRAVRIVRTMEWQSDNSKAIAAFKAELDAGVEVPFMEEVNALFASV